MLNPIDDAEMNRLTEQRARKAEMIEDELNYILQSRQRPSALKLVFQIAGGILLALLLIGAPWLLVVVAVCWGLGKIIEFFGPRD